MCLKCSQIIILVVEIYGTQFLGEIYLIKCKLYKHTKHTPAPETHPCVYTHTYIYFTTSYTHHDQSVIS